MFQDALDAATKAQPNAAKEINIGLVATFAASIVLDARRVQCIDKRLASQSQFAWCVRDLMPWTHWQRGKQKTTINALPMPLNTCQLVMSRCWPNFQWPLRSHWRSPNRTAPILTSPDCAVMAIQQRMKHV